MAIEGLQSKVEPEITITVKGNQCNIGTTSIATTIAAMLYGNDFDKVTIVSESPKEVLREKFQTRWQADEIPEKLRQVKIIIKDEFGHLDELRKNGGGCEIDVSELI